MDEPGSRKKAGKKRVANATTFKPGQSGNPSGRPKKTLEMIQVEEQARKYSEVAITALVAVAEQSTDLRAKTAAAEALLDRGWGKPTDRVISDTTVTHVDVRVRAASAILEEALAGFRADAGDSGVGEDGLVLPAPAGPET